jgi:hypothetical protein
MKGSVMKRVFCIVACGMSALASAGQPDDATKRTADIAYWTSGYQGEDLVSGRFSCPPPVFPAVSSTNEQIKATSSAYTAWQTCYNGFAANLNSVMASQRIPADLAKQMTPGETEQAFAHLDKVYSRIIDKASQDAAAVGASYTSWERATQKQVSEDNKARTLEYDILKRDLDQRQLQVMQNARPVAAPTTGTGK